MAGSVGPAYTQIGSIEPTLFSVIDLQTSNGLMPAAGELMMLTRLLIVPGVEDEMLNIGVNLRLLVLRPRGAAKESHNE